MQMLQYALVNNEIVPNDEAHISTADRGFRFGDGLFETLRIEDFTPYQWNVHMARLSEGLVALRIDADIRALKPLARRLIQKNQLMHGFLRISISRGVGSLGYRPHGCTPTIIMETMPSATYDATPQRLFISDFQRPNFESVPANAKLAYGITNTLALLKASDHACEDAVILSPCGHVAETASANIFWLSGGNLHTPPLRSACVAGTTRSALFRLMGETITESLIRPDDLLKADEVFITNVRSTVRSCSFLENSQSVQQTRSDEILKTLRLDIHQHVMAERSYWQQ